MKQIILILSIFTIFTLFGCGGGGGSVIQEESDITMTVGTPYTMSTGQTITGDGTVEFNTDIDTGVTTATLTSGSATIVTN